MVRITQVSVNFVFCVCVVVPSLVLARHTHAKMTRQVTSSPFNQHFTLIIITVAIVSLVHLSWCICFISIIVDNPHACFLTPSSTITTYCTFFFNQYSWSQTVVCTHWHSYLYPILPMHWHIKVLDNALFAYVLKKRGKRDAAELKAKGRRILKPMYATQGTTQSFPVTLLAAYWNPAYYSNWFRKGNGSSLLYTWIYLASWMTPIDSFFLSLCWSLPLSFVWHRYNAHFYYCH